MKEIVRKTPVIGSLVRHIYRQINRRFTKQQSFAGSEKYWETRYTKKGTSGAGSYGKLAEYKAEIINSFVSENDVQTIIEFGCGDGNQLRLAQYPKYLGFDVSKTAVSLCQKLFETDPDKEFKLMREYNGEKADLVLSLDVIFHLIEDEIFETYMETLFSAANKFVLIYSSNFDELYQEGSHERYRKFTDWIDSNLSRWKLKDVIPNRYPYKGDNREGSYSDFFIYEAT